MQKDEDDILEEWILYHGYLFGYDNLYIIDNCSGTASQQILKRYQAKGIHVSAQDDYSKKGEYLYQLIQQTRNQCDLAIPLDIDEFIGYVDLKNLPMAYLRDLVRKTQSLDQAYYLSRYPQVKTEAKTPEEVTIHYVTKGYLMQWSPCTEERLVALSSVTSSHCQAIIKRYGPLLLVYYPHVASSCDREQILSYFREIIPRKEGRYSFAYYLTSRCTEIDYEHPIQQITSFDVVDYEHYDGKFNYNKKFFEPCKLLSLDHGNHFGRVEGLTQTQYYKTQLVLFHLHHRGVRKLIEKCRNDIRGLKIVQDFQNVRELRDKVKQKVCGAHNIETYLTYLTAGPGALLSLEGEGITIDTLARKIQEIQSQK
uniref:Uncharacterized protein n=1 Tax=viral metagenome TaxID=1070528 RepID=A0A6C0BL75_9ZZZZ